jgi:hypothetical protein
MKGQFDVELYSGDAIVKAVRCKIASYNMSSTPTVNVRERLDLQVLVEGVDYTVVSPVFVESAYDYLAGTLTVRTTDLMQEDNGAYIFDIGKLSLFNVQLQEPTAVTTVTKNSLTVKLSEKNDAEVKAVLSGATFSAMLQAKAGWNTIKSDYTEVAVSISNRP